VIAFLVLVKCLAALSGPVWGDLVNWAGIGDNAVRYLTIGRLPPVGVSGIYWPMGFVIAPFVWAWMRMPIEHPQFDTLLFSNSTSALCLRIMLQIPTATADMATAVLVSKLVQKTTGSLTGGRLASIIWLGNPLNILSINYMGMMDVIPTSVFVLAVYLASRSKQFRSGLTLSLAALLRVFPIVTFPFLLIGCQRRSPPRMRLIAGVLVPFALGLTLMYSYGLGSLASIFALPSRQYWLLDFLGVQVKSLGIRLGFLLVSTQFFICMLYWRKHNLVHLAAVPLLALFLGALPYGGDLNHSIWVTPLLTVSLVLSFDEIWIFVLLYSSLAVESFYGVQPIDTLLWAALYAFRAVYLLKINLEEIDLSRNPSTSPSIQEPQVNVSKMG